MATYPEHEKLARISDKSQAIGEFVDWLSADKGIHLAEWKVVGGTDVLFYAAAPITDLLAEHFGIDQDKLEDEKRAMLEAQREMNRKAKL